MKFLFFRLPYITRLSIILYILNYLSKTVVVPNKKGRIWGKENGDAGLEKERKKFEYHSEPARARGNINN